MSGRLSFRQGHCMVSSCAFHFPNAAISFGGGISLLHRSDCADVMLPVAPLRLSGDSCLCSGKRHSRPFSQCPASLVRTSRDQLTFNVSSHAVKDSQQQSRVEALLSKIEVTCTLDDLNFRNSELTMRYKMCVMCCISRRAAGYLYASPLLDLNLLECTDRDDVSDSFW